MKKLFTAPLPRKEVKNLQTGLKSTTEYIVVTQPYKGPLGDQTG